MLRRCEHALKLIAQVAVAYIDHYSLAGCLKVPENVVRGVLLGESGIAFSPVECGESLLQPWTAGAVIDSTGDLGM